MENVFYEFPPYALKIAEQVRVADWLIHSFELDKEEDCYNPAGYLYNAEFFGREYTIYLDLNIYQYVLSAYKKQHANDLYRSAIALMVFGKFTNIVFDPTLAIYEKLNYSKECPDELISDLDLFRRIDNADMENLAKFALGYTNEIQLPDINLVDHQPTKIELTKYRRLKKWDSLYLVVLEVVKLYHFENSGKEEKFTKFLRWCFGEFGYSLVAIALLILLLGNRPAPKLMKYKLRKSAKERKDALVNMAWDLFLLDKYFEYWVNKPEGKEFIYASNDRPLKEVLELAISIQVNESCDHLTDYLPKSIIQQLSEIPRLMMEKSGRKIFSADSFQRYRNELIANNESLLLANN